MKLTTKQQDEPVVIELCEYPGGVEVSANGHEILAILDDGTILLSGVYSNELEKLGFQIDENNRVVVK